MEFLEMDSLLTRALREDVGSGDITTNACVPESVQIAGRFLSKEPGVLCGMDILRRVFMLLDGRIRIEAALVDGTRLTAGDTIAEISGPARAILTGERLALNLLQRLSGIATRTDAAVCAVSGTNAIIVDTRKTTPGLRALEKYAVKTGGGGNHRFGLFDGVLIKDNHIVAAGGIASAVAAARRHVPHTLKIEVETETLDQVREALEAGADIIMLDNMDLAQMRRAVTLVGGRARTEASGNMGDRRLSEVAETGVDFISIGALTHTVRALDISLKFHGQFFS